VSRVFAERSRFAPCSLTALKLNRCADVAGLDSTFVAVLYTSDSEHVIRYTDEGGTSEFCKWTIDLSTLPSFADHARMGGQVRFSDMIESEYL
jgi:hypothetical protein